MTPRTQLDLRPAACCPSLVGPDIDEDEAATAATLFKALSDPGRVRIVNMLANGPDSLCVCDLTGELGLSQATVSHHLKKLTDAGLLDREQRGIWGVYTLNRKALARVAKVFGPRG